LDGISSLAARPQYGQVIIEIKVINADHDTKAAGSGVLSRRSIKLTGTYRRQSAAYVEQRHDYRGNHPDHH
jgi:hypothetical protein